MEYRKLISFGKNSFVVSIPKNWIRQNKLQKGDLIHIENNGPNLLLNVKETKQEVGEKKKIIFIDGKSRRRLEKEIRAAYLLNYRTIVMKGKEIGKKIKALQTILQSLIALEVMEQTHDTIVAKDFLNMDKVAADELLHKMDMVTRAMFYELSTNLSEDAYLSCQERDKDVNRLFFLLYRSALYNLDNPLNTMRNYSMTPIDVINHFMAGFYVEGAADEVRRTLRHAYQLKISEAERKKLQQYLQSIYEYYVNVMRAFYSRDEQLALSLCEEKRKFNKMILLYMQKHKSNIEYVEMTSKIRRLLSHVHNIVKLVYQGFNYHDYEEVKEESVTTE